ncbi:hypothetical protein HMPREF9120_01208 [Neisseria sp. oral taxon 020 str. F0370]|nr:hypothetical protein HMPREF9120_01208 [Neisseria sp. oral taxon 020 str. F0370]
MHLPFYAAKSASKVDCQHALGGRLKTVGQAASEQTGTKGKP